MLEDRMNCKCSLIQKFRSFYCIYIYIYAITYFESKAAIIRKHIIKYDRNQKMLLRLELFSKKVDETDTICLLDATHHVTKNFQYRPFPKNTT